MKPKRFMELEGLRGLAALLVVVDHLVFAFYPTFRSGDPTTTHGDIGTSIYGTPLALLWSGTFAVAVFFVLSGFVLSIGYMKTRDRSILKKLAMSRYLRLMLPALVSVLMVLLLMKVGFGQMPNAAGAITGSPILHGQWTFDPNFLHALKEGAVSIFLGTPPQFNDVLWTMHAEFFGSFMVFGFLAVFGAKKYRSALYAVLLLLTFNSWLMAFVIGMMMADAYVNVSLAKLKKAYIVIPLLLGGLYLGGLPHGHSGGTMYSWLFHLPVDNLMESGGLNYEMFYLTIAAAMTVFAVLLSRRISAFLSKPRIALLGRFTFSLYLTHYMILYAFGSAIFLILHTVVGYGMAALLTVVAIAPIIVAVTIGFERYIDAPSIRFSKYVGAVLRRERPLGLGAASRKAWRRTALALEKYIGLSGDPKASYAPED